MKVFPYLSSCPTSSIGTERQGGEKEGEGKERYREGEQRWMTAQKGAPLKETQINKSQMHMNPNGLPHRGLHTAWSGGEKHLHTPELTYKHTYIYMQTHTQHIMFTKPAQNRSVSTGLHKHTVWITHTHQIALCCLEKRWQLYADFSSKTWLIVALWLS